jgi:hypothetical protein
MEQFDITEFAKMFDAALSSNNPTVQKALRNFMLVAAVVHAQNDNNLEKLAGPLETLVRKVTELERLIYEMRRNQDYVKSAEYRPDRYVYTNGPSWVYNPNTSITSTSSSIAWKDIDNASVLANIKDIMKSVDE